MRLRWLMIPATLSCCGALAVFAREPGTLGMTLEESRNLALLQNFEVQAARLGAEGARRMYQSARAALWEPALVASLDRNDTEQETFRERTILPPPFRRPADEGMRYLLEEQRNAWEVGVEQPLPIGGTVRLGYRMSDLDSNRREQLEIEGPRQQYEGMLGLYLDQPLLKGAGFRVTAAMMEMAQAESDIAFQQWRRQLMQTLAGVEAAYWNLNISQERLAYRRDSVRVAEKILEDNRVRVETGRMSDIEVWQAEAGLALRQAQLLEAQQLWVEASNQLRTFFSEVIHTGTVQLYARDQPRLELIRPSLDDLLAEALLLHPDYLMRELALQQEQVRLRVARNMTLPELNLRASYGFTGLGESASEARQSAQDRDQTAWSIGLVARVPLGGGQAARRELEATRLRFEQQWLGRNATRVELQNLLANSIRRVANSYEQARSYQNAVSKNEALLKTELARLEAGQSDSRKVLDIEELLTQARDSYSGALTRYVVAVIEQELSAGVLLVNRSVDPMRKRP